MRKFITAMLCAFLMLIAIPNGESCSATLFKGEPVLVVEEPAMEKSYTNEFTVSGYSLNHSGVKEVNTYIDGKLKKSCTTNIKREDRYELLKKYMLTYPQTLHCGFSTSYNLLDVKLGLHSLKVESIGKDNTKAETTLYIYVYEAVDGNRIAEVVTDKADKAVPFYRYWKKASDEHFYSISFAECKSKGNYEGENLTCFGYAAQVEGTIPVYRFYRYSDKSYLYTSDEVEASIYRNDALNYRNDGVQLYINSAQVEDTMPLYRYVKFDSPKHNKAIYFYTFNWNELGADNGEYYFKEIVGYVRTYA